MPIPIGDMEDPTPPSLVKLCLVLPLTIFTIWMLTRSQLAVALPLPKENVAYLKNSPRKSVTLGCYKVGNSFKLGIIKGSNTTEVKFSLRRGKQLGTTLFNKALRECKNTFSRPECSDKRDNDLDGARDFPNDTSCLNKDGVSENTPQTDLPAAPAPPSIEPSPPPTLQHLELLTPPFHGEFAISNHFDHEYPRQFVDNNGFLRTTDDEKVGGIDGHDGYDFRVPEGTELLATADGEVIFSGSETPFLCPILNKTVSGLKVVLRHKIAGRTFDVIYLHLSSLSVSIGQNIPQGSVIGLSGNTGCSTGPHLHLEITERINGKSVVIDPFGWNSSALDPWSIDGEGTSSPLLWRSGSSPILYREGIDTISSASTTSVGITKVRWMGRRDDLNPTNEFVEFTVNSRILPGGTFNLSGAKVRNNAGDEYTFPTGTTITDGTPLRLYSGLIAENSTTRSWKRSAPVWSNSGDCVQLFSSSGRRMYTFVYGGGVCPSLSSTNRRKGRGIRTQSPNPNHGEALFEETDMKEISSGLLTETMNIDSNHSEYDR